MTDNSLIESIKKMHLDLGILRANLNWISCADTNGITNQYKNVLGDIKRLEKVIRMTRINIDLQLDDDEMTALDSLCLDTAFKSTLDREEIIEKEHRPPNLVYNMKAIINKTDKFIPEDIIIGLSYGWKFLFPYNTNNKNIHEILAQLENCIDDTISPISQHEAYTEIARALNGRSKFTHDDTIRWLRFLASRTANFFKLNDDIFATRSDKGGHTVIIGIKDYEDGMESMLNDPSYELLDFDPLNEMVKREKFLMNIFKKNFKTKDLLEGNYEPNIKQLAKFYVLVKIHKEGLCFRPITAMKSAPGHASGKIFNKILKAVFPVTVFHIKDSYQMKLTIDQTIIRETDILVSFDVVSMYTNIPRELVKEIVMSKSTEIHDKFGIGKRILSIALDFLLSECTVFTALGKTYKQVEGLPMGGCISTTLARLVMDRVANNLLLKEPSVSFMRIFVDDTIVAIRRDLVEHALKVLNDFHPKINFTCELENTRRSINFLNLTLIREGNFIITNWYRKHFASGRLLPYYSSHKRTTIMATAEHFIRTVLELSDPFFHHTNRSIVERTLTDNGFPETTVMVLMNNFYTYMPRKPLTEKKNNKYKIFPHAICEGRAIKRILNRLKDSNVVYADSTKNTKINFVTTKKTITPWEKRGNIIVGSECVCRKKKKYTSTRFNENGEIAAGRILTTFNQCSGDQHAFRELFYRKGLAYKKQTKYLLKYTQWREREKTICADGMPNHTFMRVMQNATRMKYKKAKTSRWHIHNKHTK